MKVFEEIGRYLNKVNVFIAKQKPIVLTLAFFVGIFIFFSFVYVNSTGEPRIDDHYFSMKYAYLLRTEGMDAVNNFDWIYFSQASKGDDAHYTVTLFNLMLIPFTYMKDMVVALKFADVFIFSLASSIIYYSLKKMGVKYAFVVALMFLSFEYIALRFFLGRAFIVITTFIFLEVYFTATKKYKSLAVISAFHILFHQATFFMPLLIVACTEFARYIVEAKVYVKSFVYAGIATVVAMMYYSGFGVFHSMFALISNIVNIQSQDTANAVSIGGNELKKINPIEKFVEMKVLVLLLFFNISAVIALFVKEKKTKTEFKVFQKEKLIYIFTFFILSVGFLIGSLFTSGRFFDFLVPITVILFALLITNLFEVKKIVFDKYILNAIKVAMVVFFGIMFVNTVFTIHKNINYTSSKHIQKAAEWINEHSEDGEVVFLYNWSDFSWMFFYNSDNVYTMGMEPLVLKDYDESLYWKYYNIFKHYYKCDKFKDCKNDIANIKEKMKNFSKKDQLLVQRSNSNGIIQSVKNDFESRFIVSKSEKFNDTILLNKNLIEDSVSFRSDNGKEVVTVFMLK